MKKIFHKPIWLRKKHFYSDNNQKVKNILKKSSIHTVCQEARCPNQSECFHKKTATFLILGKVCTRNCLFCSVKSSKGRGGIAFPIQPIDPKEPEKIASLIKELELKYAVITSVTRDDLKDGGAEHFVKTLTYIKKIDNLVKTEVLTPDFKGDEDAIKKVVSANPDVYNHNIETVERLSKKIRQNASYSKSLSVLEYVKNVNPDMITKSGVMVGIGESESEMYKLFHDIKNAGCDILTIGQYLQPTRHNLAVQEYVSEKQFNVYKEQALEIGISVVYSSPFVRSSYNAFEILRML